MQRLLEYLWGNRFYGIYALFQILALTLLVGQNNYHQAGFHSWATDVAGNYYSSVSDISDYFHLVTENQNLLRQNEELLNQQIKNYESINPNVSIVNDSLQRKVFKYFSANVVMNETQMRDNVILINRGWDAGVKPGMGVIGPNGVVGIVKDVSANYSAVMSLLNSNTRLSVRYKTSSYFGILTWPGNSAEEALLIDLPSHLKLAPGDSLFTQGNSAIFPKGLAVGTVLSSEEVDGEGFQEVTTRLSTDFSSLDGVYIVANRDMAEIDNLLKAAQE